MQEVRIQGTTNYYAVKDAYRDAMRNFNKDDRINGICCEGGSRSGKTYGISIFLCEYLNQNTGKVITIARDTFKNLKNTTYKTFEKVWVSFGMPLGVFNKSATDINYNGNLIRFTGINDSITKAHGMEQDILWINEGIFIMKDSFDQMEQRTEQFFIIDYNPCEDQSWIYEVADNRPDVVHKKTTFNDNPMAPKAQVRKILSYNPSNPENILNSTADAYKWDVYGKCVRSAGDERIYKHFELFDNWLKNEEGVEYWDYRCYWNDFGFVTDPNAFGESRIFLTAKEIYSKVYIYETGLTNADLIRKISVLNIDKNTFVICDSAEKKAIEELRRSNINAVPSRKGPDSVKHRD